MASPMKTGIWEKVLVSHFPPPNGRTCDTNGSLSQACLPRSVVSDVGLCLLIVALQRSSFAPGAVQIIQLAEGTFRPNAETPNVAPGSKPQQVQLVHVEKSNSYRKTDKPIPLICNENQGMQD